MDEVLTVSIDTISVWGALAPVPCYRVQFEVCEGSQHRVFLVSLCVANKLWNRFSVTLKAAVSTEAHSVSCEVTNVHERNSLAELAGRNCPEFRYAVGAAIVRKFNSNAMNTTWIAPSALYQLWKFGCSVTTELFADCFNESGVLSSYCSSDVEDVAFGSLGAWEENEDSVEGGAGNPPFNTQFIKKMMASFDEGTRRCRPYCRCVVLPLGSRYNVLGQLNKLTSEGTLLVTAPSACFPFQKEGVLLSRSHINSRPHIFQSIGLAVWCNREYMLKKPPPLDIQEMFEVWVDHSLCNPEKVTIHENGFDKAFPITLRKRQSLLEPLLRAMSL